MSEKHDMSILARAEALGGSPWANRANHPATWGNWLLSGGLALGFLSVEAFNHAHRRAGHGVPVAERLEHLLSSPTLLGEVLNLSTYLVYLGVLLLPGLVVEAGVRRRLVLALGLELAVGAAYVWATSQAAALLVGPCFQAAAALVLVMALKDGGSRSFVASIVVALLIIGVPPAVAARHAAVDILGGGVLGWVVYRVSSCRAFRFLDEPKPWAVMRHEIKNLRNLIVSNSVESWNEMYRAGEWEFLRSADQRPRHYVIAGILRDRFAQGGAVLDVGCGHGVLGALLGGTGFSYTGIDPAEAAVRECRRTFAGEDSFRFQTVRFEDFRSDDRFDAVVLNEVLYYFPVRATAELLQRAQDLLRDERSVVIVSMGTSPKVKRIWRRISRLHRPEQTIQVTNLRTRSLWTVRVLRKMTVTAPGTENMRSPRHANSPVGYGRTASAGDEGRPQAFPATLSRGGPEE